MFTNRRVLTNCGIIFFCAYMILLAFSGCDAESVRVLEGEMVPLIFSYPCDSKEVTLFHRNRIPLYNSTIILESKLLSNTEILNYKDTRNDNCVLNMNINPVKKDNEGTYRLRAYKDGTIIKLVKLKVLVDYLPSKILCESSVKYNDGEQEEMLVLKCSARTGNVPGKIVCYQNRTMLPPATLPEENGGNLTQRIWARRENHPIYCCASSLRQATGMCECKDWGWDPIQNLALTNIKDPCSVLVSTHDPVTVSSPYGRNNSKISTAPPKADTIKRARKMKPASRKLIFVFVSLLLLFIMLILTH